MQARRDMSLDLLARAVARQTRRKLRVLLLGATGQAGQETAKALLAAGHQVVCFIRPIPEDGPLRLTLTDGVSIRQGNVTETESLIRDGFHGERFDVLVSCLGTRSPIPEEIRAVEYRAQSRALVAARQAGISQMVLLSCLAVQEPDLPALEAKQKFEQELRDCGLIYSIVRPSTLFSALTDQVGAVQSGQPFELVGDGRGADFKPISERDLGAYIAGCLTDRARHNQTLPIGGPGPAVTARDCAEMLFELTGQPPRYRRTSLSALNRSITLLTAMGHLQASAAQKAAQARARRHYATRSLLVRDAQTGSYDAEATPETGSDLLRDFYSQIIEGNRPTAGQSG